MRVGEQHGKDDAQHILHQHVGHKKEGRVFKGVAKAEGKLRVCKKPPEIIEAYKGPAAHIARIQAQADRIQKRVGHKNYVKGEGGQEIPGPVTGLRFQPPQGALAPNPCSRRFQLSSPLY